MNEKEYVSIGIASELLGVSKSTMYRMIERKEITYIETPGGHRRFSREDINKYLSENNSREKNAKSYEKINNKINKKEKSGKDDGTYDPRNRLNSLTGKQWLPETKSYMYQTGLGAKHPHAQIEKQHPAPFSFQDVQKLIEFFTKEGMEVLDPFGGVGSTAKACEISKRVCTSIELQSKWHELAKERLEIEVGEGSSKNHNFLNGDSKDVLTTLESESIDFVVTSPPYWAILNKKPDRKTKQRLDDNYDLNYSDNDPDDISFIDDYNEFLDVLVKEFIVESSRVLKTNKYIAIIVSDFRHKGDYISFHSDLIQKLNGIKIYEKNKLALKGCKVLVQNHKSLFPYGYPYSYVENIHHQYILIFRKEKFSEKV